MVGRYPNHHKRSRVENNKQCFVGEEAQARRGILALRYPMVHGIVTNWDHMELVWRHAFDLLHVSAAEHPVLLTETPLNPKHNREKMMQLIFEGFDVPASYVSLKPVLSLYCAGRTTGSVLQIGDGCCSTMSILDGYAVDGCTQRMDLAGRELTRFMARMLGERGHALENGAELEMVREMKEKHCYVPLDFQAETHRALRRTHKLPDGHTLLLGSECFRCPELLFRPALLGRYVLGVHELLHQAIQSADISSRKELYSNVVLSGGSTLFPGIVERVQQELTRLAPSTTPVQVTTPSGMAHPAWTGGSILASICQHLWISKEAYHNIGPSVAQKCK